MSEQVIELAQQLIEKLHEEDVQIEDPEMETIEDFMKTTDIRIDVLSMHENPYRPNSQQFAYHYSCQLRNEEGQWFVVYFSKGLGFRLWRSPPDEFESSGKPLHVPIDKIDTQYDGPLPPFEGDDAAYDQIVFEKCSVPALPNTAEVLDCLANESLIVERTGSFESWCSSIKGSQDSLSTKKTYEICCQHRLKLRALLGPEQYHRLVYEMDRDIRIDSGYESSESS